MRNSTFDFYIQRYIATVCLFGVAVAAKKQPLWVKKTNKSELQNRLTYRVLNEKFWGQNPNLEKLKK